jgi:hypothetical protein
MTREETPVIEQQDLPAEADFIAQYGDIKVEGDESMTLNGLLAMEERFCPAPAEARNDPEKRVAYMAKMVGVAALAPEHAHLVPKPEPEELAQDNALLKDKTFISPNDDQLKKK